jgi:hypothetical protein
MHVAAWWKKAGKKSNLPEEERAVVAVAVAG